MRALATTSLVLTAAFAGPVSAPAQTAASGLTLIDAAGRHPIATVTLGDQELISLADLAAVFRLDVAEDSRTRSMTVTSAGRRVILTAEQALASVDGRLVSLDGPVRRAGGRWFVPFDFIPRALAPLQGESTELRRPSRLIVAGDVRVPRVVARYQARGAGGRLTLEVSPETPYAVVEEPGRLTIRFEANAVDVGPLPPTSGDTVRAIAADDVLPGLAIDLGPAYGSHRVDATTVGATARVVIDLEPAAAAGTATAGTAAAPADTRLPAGNSGADLLRARGSRPQFRTVVIDPGHGGTDAGARGMAGTLEKDVTFAVAQRLRVALEGRLGVRVVLTRTRDERVPLDQRAAIANNNQANLFISLHANASRSEWPTGAEVFHLSIDEYGDEAREIADRAGTFLRVADGGQREIDMVPWEMAQARYLERSALFAGVVEDELGRRIPMNLRPRRQAPFRVLAGANMPAVLIEMGFLSNPEQEVQLTDPDFQASIVEALVASVLRFRDYVERTPDLPAGDAAGAGDRQPGGGDAVGPDRR